MSDVILPLESYDDDLKKCKSFCKPHHSKTWGDVPEPEVGLHRLLTCSSATTVLKRMDQNLGSLTIMVRNQNVDFT